MLDTELIRPLYTFACCGCGHEQTAVPSIAMIAYGENTGSGICLKCHLHLHLTIDDDNERMSSRLWADVVGDDINPYRVLSQCPAQDTTTTHWR